MGVQGEKQVGGVSDQQDDGDFQAEIVLAEPSAGAGQIVERRRHNQRDRRQRQGSRLRPRSGSIEPLYGVLEAPGQHGGAEHQEEVADDRTGERSLDHRIETRSQGRHRDDQLGGVSEGGIQQAAQPLAGPVRELLGGAPEPAGQRHDRQRGRQEDPRMPLRREELQSDGDRNEDQQPVEHSAIFRVSRARDGP